MARQSRVSALGNDQGWYPGRLLATMVSGENPDGTRFELPIELLGDNAISADGAVTFPNSAAAGSLQSYVIDPLPAQLNPHAKYVVVVRNPSADTALTMRLRNRETLGGVQVFPEVVTFAVPASSSVTRVVEGFLLGEASRVDFHNDTALGVAGTFSAQVRVRGL